MNHEETIKNLLDMQHQAAAMRLNFSRLVKNRALTTEQASIADTRLENFADDIDIILSDLGHEKGTPMIQNNDHIFGPAGKGDYSIGDQLTFTEGNVTLTGDIIHCTMAGATTDGRYIPLTYEVDVDDGFPHVVSTSQIVQQ